LAICQVPAARLSRRGSSQKHGQLYSDPRSKAKILQEQFCSVFTQDKDSPDRNRKPNSPELPCIGPLDIRLEGVRKLLLEINLSKAAGPDEVAGRLLKELAEELAPFVTCLFNKSITSSDIPSEWKSQWVSPVYKKGAKSEAANYRPVSLTCILSKLMEHVLCTHIRAHLDNHSVLSCFQHGFRSRHSCDTQLLLTTHDLQSLYDKKLQTDIAILDFSKAFDVVPHQRLLNKMENYGIKGPVRRWISNFLEARQQRVLVDGSFSETATVDSGVPQGTVLGPLLFLIFINDLPENIIHGTRVRLFADDCLVYRPIKSIHDQILLQQDIDRLIQWSKSWGMKFNASKCNIMSVKRGLNIQRFYHMDGHVLASTTTAKYLGVTFTDDLSWSTHISEVAKRANQKLGFVKRNLRGCPTKCKALAYISLVRSGMEYAALIWDPYLKKDINLLERVQNKSARWVKSDYDWSSSVSSMTKQLGWAELETRRKAIRLSFIYKMAETKEVKARKPRNYVLGGSGVMRFSQSRMYKKHGVKFIKNKATKEKKRGPKAMVVKEIKGDNNGGKRVVRANRMPRNYQTSEAPRKLKNHKNAFSQHKHKLRPSITPGTILILLAGKHKGKRVVFLKQLVSGLLLVTGPFHLNGCPLRRINQLYVIATKTSVDVSAVVIPERVNDTYFNRQKLQKPKHAEGEIFDTKKEEYTVSDERKEDQVSVDKQVLVALRSNPDKKLLMGYLGTMFSLKNHQYPHKMIF